MEKLMKRGIINPKNAFYAKGCPKGKHEDFCKWAKNCEHISDRSCPYLVAIDRLTAYEDICFDADRNERISINRLRELVEAAEEADHARQEK